MRSALTVSLCAWVPDLDQLLSAPLTAGPSAAESACISMSWKTRGAYFPALYLWRLLKWVKCQWDEVWMISGFATFFLEVRRREYLHHYPHQNKTSGSCR